MNNVTRCLRFYSIVADNVTNSTITMVKPFEAIPGPRGLLGLGTLLQYLPLVGTYSWQALHKAGYDKYQQYGSIVRETIVPGQDIVWLYDPNDIATLLNERDYPQRRSHLALEKYRKDRPHIYRSAGLLPTNGPEWWRLRSEIQKELSAPQKVRCFLEDVDRVTQEFLIDLPVKQSFNVLPNLARLNLELTCFLTFNVRLNSFAPKELSAESLSTRLIKAAETTNSSILPTDQGLQWWRLFETPTYKRLRYAQEYMESVALDLVARNLNTLRKDNDRSKRKSLIDEYLKNSNLDISDVVVMATDLILAGIDTTSYSMAFVLYHVARNPSVQQKLLEESMTVLKHHDDCLSADALRTEMTYTRAVLKESLRLNPISVGVGRILNKDLVLGGYHVPKGTVVVTQNMVACRLEKHFTNASTFLPERWLQRRNTLNPYLVLPFGHGMRACIARRLAEQNILVFLLKLIRNYEISWTGGSTPLDVRTLLINKPSDPVMIRLRKRV